jgi:hypothetical protein
MRRPTLTIFSLFLAALTPLGAQETVFQNHGAKATLIELYSSEGCSSCPPAEAWLSGLKSSPRLWQDLFPVAFHVDYWDGLGWPDRFAKPAYTERQRNYAAALGQDSVYTPEFVAGGREWRGWFHGEREPAGTATSGALSLRVAAGGASVSAVYTPAGKVGSQAYTLNLALLGLGISSDVKGGENGGRKLQHDFIVLDFQSRPLTKAANFSSGPVGLKSSTSDAPGAVVAWVSAADGSIVQVAGGAFKPAEMTAAVPGL